MAREDLHTLINTYIKANNNEEITGDIMNGVLNEMVDGISDNILEGAVRYDKTQELTEEEKAQARANIGAEEARVRPYLSLTRKDKYLYEVTFDTLPEDNGGNMPLSGACSSFVSGGKMFRNLDWNYDNTASFIVKTGDFEGMSFVSGLNDGEMDDELISQLPYRIVDGINKHGIRVSTHVLFNDWNWTGAGNRNISITRLPYLILSRVKSIATLRSDLSGVLDNLKAVPGTDYLIQCMVTDGTTTYAILPPTSEWLAFEVQDITSNPKLTNFRWVNKSEVTRGELQNKPTGVERWNMMPCPLKDLRFTIAYEEPNRLSEFIGIDGTTKDSTDEELTVIYNRARAEYLQRERDGKTWQTVHSVVYDGNGMIELHIQENWEKDMIFPNGSVRYDIEQELTDAQKQQAITNIGAADTNDVLHLNSEYQTVEGTVAFDEISSDKIFISSPEDIEFDEDTLGDKLDTLNERIDNISIGRFLSTWDASEGTPDTEPEELPYAYVTGDYFVVSKIGTTNYRPSGVEYDGEPSTTIEINDISVNDIYRFDGTSWTLLHIEQKEISFSNLAGDARDNASLNSALNEIDRVRVASYNITTLNEILSWYNQGYIILVNYNNDLYSFMGVRTGLTPAQPTTAFFSSIKDGINYMLYCSAVSGGATTWTNTLFQFEDIHNKVTEIDSSSTNTEYPSAKAVYDELESKQDTLIAGTGISIAADGKTISATSEDRIKFATFQQTTYSEVLSWYNQGYVVVCKYYNSLYYLGGIDKDAVIKTAYFFAYEEIRTNKDILILLFQNSVLGDNWNTKTIQLEDANNKKTSITSSSTDTQYPTAKAVWTLSQTKQDTLIAGTGISIAADGKTISATSTDNIRVAEYYVTPFDTIADWVEEGRMVFCKYNDYFYPLIYLYNPGYGISYARFTKINESGTITYLSCSQLNGSTTWAALSQALQKELIAGEGISIASDGKTISATGGSGTVRYDQAQSLTDAQKLQARENIGADFPFSVINGELNITYTE